MSSFYKTKRTKNAQYDKALKFAPYSGIYLGVVRQASEETRSGKLMVFIPALAKDPEDYASATFNCFWSSPFAGSTDPTMIGKDIKEYETGQKSYGLWMVPPDIGNYVLVCFADGNVKMPYVISTLFPDQLTHMTPGMPYGKDYSTQDSIMLPVIEKNRRDEKLTHNDATRPVAVDIAEWVVKQGLINDPIRGMGTSGSRRESPSEVFGILTPGPRDPDNFDHRLGGHQFIMDDNVDSRLIRLRTAQGHQLLMDDTNGIMYLINKKGNAWIELSDNGDIHVYADGDINYRAHGDFNLRADKNVRIEAGNDVLVKAAGDYTDTYVGKGAGNGGNIQLEAAVDYTMLAEKKVQITANTETMDISAAKNMSITSKDKDVAVHAGGSIKEQAGRDISNKAGSNWIVSSGKASITAGMILLNSGGPAAHPAPKAQLAPELPVTNHKDAKKTPPEFDREAANIGGNAVPTDGERTGTEDNIETIVTVMPTLEPWKGHAKFDSANTPGKGSVGSSGGGSPSSSVQTPSGSRTGNGG